MSTIKEKDYRRALNKIVSQKDSEMQRRKLSDVATKYLKAYPDSAINLIERTVLDKVDENSKALHGLELAFLEAAKYYSNNENYDRAEELLDG